MFLSRFQRSDDDTARQRRHGNDVSLQETGGRRDGRNQHDVKWQSTEGAVCTRTSEVGFYGAARIPEICGFIIIAQRLKSGFLSSLMVHLGCAYRPWSRCWFSGIRYGLCSHQEGQEQKDRRREIKFQSYLLNRNPESVVVRCNNQ